MQTGPDVGDHALDFALQSTRGELRLSDLLRDRIHACESPLELDAIRRDVNAAEREKRITKAQHKALLTAISTKRFDEEIQY